VNGAANQSVAASTRYYVYAFVNSGTVTCDFSTTTHATSTTTGNAGTEIKSGDDTRSLVGMVYTSSSSQFQQSGSVIGVLSWFNRLGITVSGGTANVSFSNTGALFNIGSAAVFGMLNWANEATFAQFYSASSNSGAWVNLGIGLDGSSGSAATQFSATQLVYGAASSGPATGSATGGGWGNPSEGFHNYWIAAQTAAGTSMTLLNTDAHGYTRG
jgi:hypothetical protein